MTKTIVGSFAFNEGIKIYQTVKRFPPASERNYDFYVVDDGSTDGSIEKLQDFEVNIIKNKKNLGIGESIKNFIHYAKEHNYDIIVIMAGNDKDRPDEISKLINPIIEDKADFVQGSRYLPGGNFGNMPFYRQIATRFVHPFLMRFFTGVKVTDTTNGFRAFRTNLIEDTRININQNWLQKYELEPYLYFKALKLKHRVSEVPVTKIYPDKKLGQSKMLPIIDWWSILRPLFLLGLGLRK